MDTNETYIKNLEEELLEWKKRSDDEWKKRSDDLENQIVELQERIQILRRALGDAK